MTWYGTSALLEEHTIVIVTLHYLKYMQYISVTETAVDLFEVGGQNTRSNYKQYISSKQVNRILDVFNLCNVLCSH